MVVHVIISAKEILHVSVPLGSLVHTVKLLLACALTILVIMVELVFMILEDSFVPVQQGIMEPTAKNLTPVVKTSIV